MKFAGGAVPALAFGAARGCGTTDAPSRLSVLSYNIAHGEGSDGRIDLERIAAIITSSGADLVALQEVDVRTERSGGVDQAAELARLTGFQSVFGGNLDFQGGQYGNTVLSRLPIAGHANHPLPNPAGTEPRGVLEVRLGNGAPELIFLVTHLDHQEEANRLASVEWIRTFVRAMPEVPMLLAGDLNASPESAVMEAVADDWRHTNLTTLPTYPADSPDRQIDYVLYRPESRWRVISAEVLPEPVASDHRPLLAELSLRAL